MSYRSRDPLRVIAEVTQWQGHPTEQLRQMKENVARAMAEGAAIID
jgi:rifampin ADP-ribosylating transferase